MFKAFKLAVFCLLLFRASYAQKADVYGKWYFDRFGGTHGEIVHSKEAEKSNKLDKGFSFTFTNNDHAIVESSGGSKHTVSFKYLADRQEIIFQGDTMKILLLTKDILELYSESGKKDALFLKRSKNGKTAMSAP